MTIETLIKAVPPPLAPTYTFDGPWEPIEAELGTPLPQDYKDLVRLYGFGTFMGHLSVNGPTVPYDHCRLLPEAFAVQRMFVENSPHIHMYPQPGGLLVCGNVEDVGYLFWLTRGPVDEWPIVVWDHGALEEDELKLFEFDLTDSWRALSPATSQSTTPQRTSSGSRSSRRLHPISNRLRKILRPATSAHDRPTGYARIARPASSPPPC